MSSAERTQHELGESGGQQNASAVRSDDTQWRAELRRKVFWLCAAMAIVAASLGAIAVTSGVPLWLVTVMAALVFAGGSEFMVIGLTAAGAGPLTAVLGGLMLNARHVPFGFAVGGAFGSRWWSRLLGAHLMIDESVAFALAENAPHRRRRAYWTAGFALFLTWAPSVFLGGLLGRWVGDPEVLGLDAAMPAALFALIAPSLRDFPTLRAVILGAVLAVGTTPFLPDGLPVLVAVLAVAAALPLPRSLSSRRSHDDGGASE